MIFKHVSGKLYASSIHVQKAKRISFTGHLWQKAIALDAYLNSWTHVRFECALSLLSMGRSVSHSHRSARGSRHLSFLAISLLFCRSCQLHDIVDLIVPNQVNPQGHLLLQWPISKRLLLRIVWYSAWFSTHRPGDSLNTPAVMIHSTSSEWWLEYHQCQYVLRCSWLFTSRWHRGASVDL